MVVADRIANAAAVVALESSVLAQGLPSPANLESAEAQQAAVVKADAEPAVIGVLAGRLIVGADPQEVQALASGAVRGFGVTLSIGVVMDGPGQYEAIRLSSREPLPPPQAAGLEVDVLTAREGGAQVASEPPVTVR